MTEKQKSLKSVLNLWTPEPQILEPSFDMSPLIWSTKSPILKRQKTVALKTDSPLRHATTLKVVFENEINEISEFLHFKQSDIFTKDYPITKVLYINNFFKPKNDNMVTNKFIFHIRARKKRFTPIERLNEELKELFIKETHKPNLDRAYESINNNRLNNYIKSEKKIDNSSKTVDYKAKIIKNKNIKNLKFNGKKVLSSFSFIKRSQKPEKIQSETNITKPLEEKLSKMRPYSAANCLESAERQYKFLENLLEKKPKLLFSKKKQNL